MSLTHDFNINNVHEDEDIYVLGDGEELYHITEEQKKFLDTKTTINVNYSHLSYKGIYYITGHTSHLLYMLTHSPYEPGKVFYQGRSDGFNEFDTFNKTTICKLTVKELSSSSLLSRKYDPNKNFLYGAANIPISAINLAYIMGAKRIILIGFNQKNYLHHYNMDEKLTDTLRTNINSLLSRYENCSRMRSDVGADFKKFMSLFKDPDTLRNTNYNQILSPRLNNLQSRIEGCTLVSCTKHSVFVDSAVANYISIEDLINENN